MPETETRSTYPLKELAALARKELRDQERRFPRRTRRKFESAAIEVSNFGARLKVRYHSELGRGELSILL